MKKTTIIIVLVLICSLFFGIDQEKLNKDLYNAAGSANLTAVKKLLTAGANINSREGLLGWTPLMKVLFGKVTKAKSAVFDYLLQNGADINV
jgi:ankyrin repeat protein